jgi:UDP-N-acetylmuramyl pentapeptide phosphotransferase/UDP-N-acetylglucosamine-1-phosphate transferase
MSAAASASLKSRVHPVPVLTSPLLYIFDTMTIVTTVDSKKKDRRRTMPKTDEEHAHQKADTIEKKIKLKVAIVAAIEAIDKIINNLADEH